MPTYGIYQRAQPRLIVVRGYPGNEPGKKTYSAPVSSGVTIYSGQVISLSSGSWVLGCPAGATPYLAWQDSSDTDVLASGKLLGFSCSGEFVFQTGYYTAAAGAYNVNDLPLKADTGSTVASPPSGAGNVTLATGWNDTADIIGVTYNGGLQNVTLTNSQAAPSGSPPVLYMLEFATQWMPKRS